MGGRRYSLSQMVGVWELCPEPGAYLGERCKIGLPSIARGNMWWDAVIRGTCLWMRIEIRKWRLVTCRGVRCHEHEAEISASVERLGWCGCGTREGSVYGTCEFGSDGSSNLIQCETAFLDFSLTAGSSEGVVRSLSM
jgi:hypothetical protein